MALSRVETVGLESLNSGAPYIDEEGQIYLEEKSYEGIGEQEPFDRGDRSVVVSCIGYRSMRRLRVWDTCVSRLPLFRCFCPQGDSCCVGTWWPRIQYIFKIRYQRYEWTIMKTYQKMKKFLRKMRDPLLNLSAEVKAELKVSAETRFVLLALICGCAKNVREYYFRRRAVNMCEIIQYIVDSPHLWTIPLVRQFLEIGPNSFDPFYGGKGPEGYMWKISGGYEAGFSRSIGDYIQMRRKRWISFSRTQITWYRSHMCEQILGVLKITPDTIFYLSEQRSCMGDRLKRCLVVSNPIRSLVIEYWDRSDADMWLLRVLNFYRRCSIQDQKERVGTAWRIPASFPPRLRTDMRLYHVPSDYFAAAAIALLGAKKEIFIASWKNTPRVLLTRPPLPPLRLDQILAHKAAQGVKVYVLLYKEVEMSGQGNDSAPAKMYLEALSPEGNISVVRHPNKIIGGSTAIWWSHHEKLTVVDRNLAFVGGIDLAVGRWDDAEKSLDDEDGIKYIGKDYRQPAEKMYNPARMRMTKSHQGSKGGIGKQVHRAGKQVHRALGSVVGTVTDFTRRATDSMTTPPSKSSVVLQEAQDEQNDHGKEEKGAGETQDVKEKEDNSDGRSTAVPSADKKANEDGERPPLESGSMSVESDLKLECRDQYPRSGWHDVHTSLSGEAARDVANHFVERWNHHRLSTTGTTGTGSSPILPYSDPHAVYGTCAKCERKDIHELSTKCPECGHGLGPVCPLFKPPTPRHIPLSMSPHPGGDYAPGMGGTRTIVQPDSVSEAEKRENEELTKNRATESVRSYIEYEFTPEEGFCVPILGSTPVVVLESEAFNYVNEANLGVISPLSIDESSGTGGHEHGDPNSNGSMSKENDEKVKIPSFMTSSSTLFVAGRGGGGGRDSSSKKANKYPFPDMKPSSGKGELLFAHGVNAEILQGRGLVPQHGDVIASINGVNVSHMDHSSLARFFQRIVDGWSKHSHSIATEIDNDDNTRRGSVMSRDDNIVPSQVQIVLRRHYVESFANEEEEEQEYATQGVADNPMVLASELDDVNTADTRKKVMRRYKSQINAAAAAARCDWNEAITFFGMDFDGKLVEPIKQGFSFAVKTKDYLYNKAQGRDVDNSSGKKNRQIDTERILNACVQCAGREIALQMSKLYSQEGTRAWLMASFPDLVLPHVPVDLPTLPIPLIAKNTSQSGSCCVQVLRSAGTWSLGIRAPECSIQVAWCDAITQAEHFVYIENQFFIGCTKFKEEKSSFHDVPDNAIPSAILARIVRAARSNEKFRVIVVVPQHPQGDIAYSMRPKNILHYQAETISKGLNSLYSRFRELCPGHEPTEYLNFYCLQNYGVVNDFFLHDQIYVHDKVCIVDDSIMIVGSANINDRSMLGDRDTEVAIRVEDCKKETITLGGESVSVGSKPHEARIRLMRMHIGDKEGALNLDDILSTEVFNDIWDKTANVNASLYSAVDGAKDIYGKAATQFDTYHHALENYVNPTVFDDNVVEAMENLQGFLIPYPHSFLSGEDLKPGLVSAIIPEILWV